MEALCIPVACVQCSLATAELRFIALIAVNVLTNYTNSVLQTEVDFPVAEELAV